MNQTAFVTGANHGLGLALTTRLLEQGWTVFAGQYAAQWSELNTLTERYPQTLHTVPLDVGSIESAREAAQTVAAVAGHLDVLINNAGVLSATSERPIQEAQDYEEMHRSFDINALGPLRMTEAFLPLLERGSGKRLCFISSEAGSIERAYRTSWFGYCMSKTALNMAVKLLFNDLRPKGYSFRLYHPGWMRSYMFGEKDLRATLEPEEAAVPALNYFLSMRDDEDRLVLRDNEGGEWPW